jgi:hypothetical protein
LIGNVEAVELKLTGRRHFEPRQRLHRLPSDTNCAWLLNAPVGFGIPARYAPAWKPKGFSRPDLAVVPSVPVMSLDEVSGSDLKPQPRN